jgi:nicotinamide-nucleotide amidase
MNAEILCIGDELLIGQVVNTNASWLAEQCSSIGIRIRRITVVGDSLEDAGDALTQAWCHNHILITTGGLGPTHDDVTREIVTSFFSTPLREDPVVLSDIERFLADRGRVLSPANRDQAMVPVSAHVIRNSQGTAPGYHFNHEGKHCFVLPGVPYEMKSMAELYMLPLLRTLQPAPYTSRTLLTTGIPESTLADILSGVEMLLPATSVAYLPGTHGVRIRLTSRAANDDARSEEMAALERFILERAGEYVYGSDDDDLARIVGDLLAAKQLTLAVAESCTGGLVSDRITNIPGSSCFFERGMIVYSNRSKTELLGVDAGLIQQHGAVSREVAEAMAAGCRERSGASIGLATTGIAGPTGGSAGKPVGTVWIALDSGSHQVSHCFHFGSHRMNTKQRTAQAALDLLRRHLLDLPAIPSFCTEAS